MTAPAARQRLAAFAIVGILGFVLQLWVFTRLTTAMGWPITAATIASVTAAVLHNFVWHDRWTWGDRGRSHERPAGRFVQYLLTTGATSVAANVAFVPLYAGVLQVPAVAAVALAVGSTSIVNFLVSDRVVFRCRP